MTGLIATTRPKSVAVRIPVATIGIRGTQFGAEVQPTSALVVLLEPATGKTAAIEVSNRFGSVTLEEPGFGTEIPDATSPPSPPRRMRLRAVENLLRTLGTIQRLQVREARRASRLPELQTGQAADRPPGANCVGALDLIATRQHERMTEETGRER